MHALYLGDFLDELVGHVASRDHCSEESHAKLLALQLLLHDLRVKVSGRRVVPLELTGARLSSDVYSLQCSAHAQPSSSFDTSRIVSSNDCHFCRAAAYVYLRIILTPKSPRRGHLYLLRNWQRAIKRSEFAPGFELLLKQVQNINHPSRAVM